MTRAVGLRAHMVRGLRKQHVRFLETLSRLLPALEHDAPALRSEWRSFELSLLTHFEAEERLIWSHVTLIEPRSAAAMQREHDLLRGRVATITLALETGTVSSDMLAVLASELRAHAIHEHSLLESFPDLERP